MTQQNPQGSEHKAHPDLHIFVNGKKFDDGIEPVMTVEAIARLVGLTAETAVVRRQHGNTAGEPLTSSVEIKQADHFVVTRRKVEGGFDDVLVRVESELARLRESGQAVTLVRSPAAVIFHDLPTGARAPIPTVDVLVPIPPGYPGAMLDLAFLPEGSPLCGRVKGAVQGPLVAAGRTWRQISYHPHNGGGGPPWNPNERGFHTYIDEILAWLGCIQ